MGWNPFSKNGEILKEKALVEAFSVIVKLQTSRRFVSSSSGGAGLSEDRSVTISLGVNNREHGAAKIYAWEIGRENSFCLIQKNDISHHTARVLINLHTNPGQCAVLCSVPCLRKGYAL